jgi:ABC-type nitrate/sulfonate/bicarbonate transport system permease component
LPSSCSGSSYIIVGARIATANAFTTIVAAEIIGAQSGLGTMLWQARLFMLVDNIYVVLIMLVDNVDVVMISLSILGLAIDWSVRTLSRYFGRRYIAHI